MGTLGQRRRLMAMCAVAVIALMAPLAGCGATGDQAEAAGGKAGGSVPAEPVVLRMLNAVGEWDSEDFVQRGREGVQRAVAHRRGRPLARGRPGL